MIWFRDRATLAIWGFRNFFDEILCFSQSKSALVFSYCIIETLAGSRSDHKGIGVPGFSVDRSLALVNALLTFNMTLIPVAPAAKGLERENMVQLVAVLRCAVIG